MRINLLIAALVFQATLALSQVKLSHSPINEYRYTGGGLVCVTDSLSSGSPLSCLHVGAIRVSAEYAGIEAKYGPPNQTIPRSSGAEIKVFHLKSKAGEITYLVLTIKDDLIEAIQVAGATPDDPLNFSSVSLGDSGEKLVGLLGQPTKAEQVEETGATLWSYAPFPFSFEIGADRVVSMKIWRP